LCITICSDSAIQSDNRVAISTIAEEQCVAGSSTTVDLCIAVCSDRSVEFNDGIAVVDNKVAGGGSKFKNCITVIANATSKGIAISSDSAI
jgi:Fe-S-cluster-containing hydrogenase component 2